MSDTYKTTHNGETSTKVRSYTYDKSNRLKTETANGYTLEYAYNKDGTLCSETGGGVVKAYSYENGRLTGYIKSGDIARTEFEYDNYGNCIQYCKTPFSSTEIEWERGNLLKKIRNTECEYNSSGLRFRKKTGNETTEYYYDGTKLLGENRNGEVIRYIYDSEGIIGFFAPTNAYPYFFVKDARNNVIAVLDEDKEVAAYEYDAWGNATSSNFNNAKIDGVDVAEFNPIRWKSQYYDTESGLYYINGRYYSPETKRYVDSGNPETALANAATIYGLNLQNSTLTNPVNELYNEYTIAAVTPIALDITEINVAAPTWLRWLVPSLQIVLGVILCFIPGAQGFGISLIAGGSIGLVSNILGSKIGGGLGTVLNGVNAIITGISLMGYGPIGWIMGGILLTVGAGTAALGANEVISGFTGNDTLRDWMGEELYDGLYLGLNIGSAVGTLAGRLYINYADVKIFDDTVPKKGKPFSRTTLITGKGVKQYRYYDRRGLALYDKDIIHGGKYKFPHYHGWLNGERLIGHWNFWELLIWLIGK